MLEIVGWIIVLVSYLVIVHFWMHDIWDLFPLKYRIPLSWLWPIVCGAFMVIAIIVIIVINCIDLVKYIKESYRK